jgi:hypothetical protein
VDGYKLIAIAIIFATIVLGWMFRYEPARDNLFHRNRFTGAVCPSTEECWAKTKTELRLEAPGTH